MAAGEAPSMRATFQGVVLAESPRTVESDGYHYFPPESVKRDHLSPSSFTSHCPSKGDATYFDVVVPGMTKRQGARTYDTGASARAANELGIKGWIAFYTRDLGGVPGVKVA
jgi:uncharacterized protein (DUF427 family)